MDIRKTRYSFQDSGFLVIHDFSDYILFFDVSDFCIPAVRADIPVIPHNKVFIRSKGYRIASVTVKVHGKGDVSIRILKQNVVDQHLAVCGNCNGFTRQSDDSFGDCFKFVCSADHDIVPVIIPVKPVDKQYSRRRDCRFHGFAACEADGKTSACQ